MEFQAFNSFSDAARAIQDFLLSREAAIPSELRTSLIKLIGPTTSAVDAVAYGAELIYSYHKAMELPSEILSLGAGLALVAERYNFHGMANENRASKIALALMRDAGVEQPTGVSYPTKEDDPVTNKMFIPVEPESP